AVLLRDPAGLRLVLRPQARTRVRRPRRVGRLSGSDGLNVAREFVRVCWAFDQADLPSPGDRVASARDAELAVDRDRLRLDRVARDEQSLPDLAEGEMGREEGEKAKLGPREARAARRAGLRHRLDLGFERRDLLAQDSERGAQLQDLP